MWKFRMIGFLLPGSFVRQDLRKRPRIGSSCRISEVRLAMNMVPGIERLRL